MSEWSMSNTFQWGFIALKWMGSIHKLLTFILYRSSEFWLPTLENQWSSRFRSLSTLVFSSEYDQSLRYWRTVPKSQTLSYVYCIREEKTMNKYNRLRHNKTHKWNCVFIDHFRCMFVTLNSSLFYYFSGAIQVICFLFLLCLNQLVLK